jgi:hypothetical protein
MMYNTQNYWDFLLCPSSGILKAREYKVSEKWTRFRLQVCGRHLLSWVP